MSGTSPLDESRKTGVDALPTTSDDNQRRGNAQSPPVHVQDVQGNFEVMGDFESDDRGITRELILPSAGKPREPDWRRPIRPITAPRSGFIGF